MDNQSLKSAAIRDVSELAVQAAGPKILKPDAEPNHVYLIARSDGTIERVEADAPHLRGSLTTPAELADWIADHHFPESTVNPARWGVYICPPVGDVAPRVEFVDETDGRDRLKVALIYSESYIALMGVQGKRINQAEFVRLLAIKLNGCTPGKEFVSIFRRLQWRKDGSTTGDYNRGRESMGKSLQQEIVGELPEDVILEVPIFERGRAKAMRCAIEIFPDTEQLALTLYPGEQVAAMDAALADVRETMMEINQGQEKPFGVYLGSFRSSQS